MKKTLQIGVSIIVVALIAVSIIKGANRERAKYNFDPMKSLEDSPPALRSLIKKHPKIVEDLGYEDVEFAEQNPEFLEYLNQNPDIVKMALEASNPRIKGAEIFEKFIKEKQNEQ